MKHLSFSRRIAVETRAGAPRLDVRVVPGATWVILRQQHDREPRHRRDQGRRHSVDHCIRNGCSRPSLDPLEATALR
jgi:hypothetical protein